MPSPEDIKRYSQNLAGERDSIFLYQALAKAEKNPELAKVYVKLAAVEEKHAKFWETKIKEAGGKIPPVSISFRSRTLATLAKRFGPRFVLPSITAMEQSDRSSYDSQPEAKGTNLPSDEHSHARLLLAITSNAQKGMEGWSVAKLEGRHRAIGGNALRAAVLGANDGLVSNLSLIMGVAGADLSSHAIMITGMAGLLAGACSMAMGEWLSVQSSRELYEKQIQVEAEELKENPEEEESEIALIYEAKGIPKEEAKKLAAALMKDEATALNTLTREELGIDPDSLGGSAKEAAFTSFILFCLGAIIPLAPFFFTSGPAAVPISLAVSSLGLFFIGAMITVLTGRGVLFSGFRQLLIGLGAAGITFAVGRLIGVNLGG